MNQKMSRLCMIFLVLLSFCSPSTGLTVIESAAELIPCNYGEDEEAYPSHPHSEWTNHSDTDHRRKRDYAHSYIWENLYSCKKKLVIILRITNKGQADTAEEYIKVVTARDPHTHQQLVLFQPVVVLLKQSQVLLAYPFHYVQMVNNKAYEIILHKDNAKEYKGCDSSDTVHSTCGRPIRRHSFETPDTGGFCCQCDNQKQNQPYHFRGGQNCKNTEIKQYGAKYHASSHCLKFDPLWYSVNRLDSPYIQHSVQLQIATEKHDDYDPRVWWLDMNNGRHIMVGTDRMTSGHGHDQVHVTFIQKKFSPGHVHLDHRHHKLLIPDPLPDNASDPMQLKEGVDGYLAVPDNEISLDGTECNKVGVSYSAFVGQNNRCGELPQSCLGNQPYDLWLHDEERKYYNKKGHYQLGNFGHLGDVPIVKNNLTEQKLLRFQYLRNHSSELLIQIVADHLQLIRSGANVQISEIYTASHKKRAKIRVFIFNVGLVAADFKVKLVKCSSGIKTTDPLKPVVTIGPHQSAEMTFNVTFASGVSPTDSVCTVGVWNKDTKQLLSERDAFIKKDNMCLCTAYCRCSCGGETACIALTNRAYRQAGYSGDTPYLYRRVHFHDELELILALSLAFNLLLLFLGCLKAITGVLIAREVGQIGLFLFREYSCTTKKEAPGMSLVQEVIANIVFFFYIPFFPMHYMICHVRCSKKKEPPAEAVPLIPRKTMKDIMPEEQELKTIPPPKSYPPQPVIKLECEEEQKEEVLHEYKQSKDAMAVQMEKMESGDMETNQDELHVLRLITDTANTETEDKKTSTSDIPVEILSEEEVEDIYYNFESATNLLKNSGSCYSLCGILKKVGDDYKFSLDSYRTQVLQNLDGKLAPLVTPLPISNRRFTKTLEPDEIQRCISKEPQFPCLNKVVK